MTPSAVLPFTIKGGDDGANAEAAPGDTLNVNFSGTAGGALTGLTQSGDDFSGAYTFGNRAPVNFTAVDNLIPPPQPPPPPPPAATAPPPSVSVAFGPSGEVIELVNSAGQLTQFDASGAHFLGDGVRAASVAFNNGSEVLLVTAQSGALIQFDAAGAHLLTAAGVLDASVAFGASGEVVEGVSTAGGADPVRRLRGAHPGRGRRLR